MKSKNIMQLYMQGAAVALFVVLMLGTALRAEAQRYDSPLEFRASQILPREMVTGPNHRVDERVINDGFQNHYKIYSKFGEYAVVSTAMLRKRVHEIHEMAAMEQLKLGKEFLNSFKESGFKTLEGAKNLITSPVKTVYGTVAGVGTIFKNASQNLFGFKKSEAEESQLKDVIGFSKTKRDYAYQFSVDVYSRNQPMQKRLDQITWAGYFGGLSMSAALAPISGGASIAISVSRLSKLFNEIFRTVPPSELRAMNQKKLLEMGINEDLVDLFLNNAKYSPREQTLLVGALAEIKGARNRAAFVKFAVPTDNPDMAFFRYRQAEMYAGYNKSVEPIERFEGFGRFAAARTRDGKLVFNVPLDYLAWTENMAGFIDAAISHTKTLPRVTEKHLWVTGSVSPLALKELNKRGMLVHDRREGRLLGTEASVSEYIKRRTPSATLEVKATSVAIGVGFQWGDGKLKFKGREYAFSVQGLSLVDVSFTSISATGKVFNLNNVDDFSGTYVASKAALAVGGGKGDLTMRNGKNVSIHLRSDQTGVAISLGAGGLTVKLK